MRPGRLPTCSSARFDETLSSDLGHPIERGGQFVAGGWRSSSKFSRLSEAAPDDLRIVHAWSKKPPRFVPRRGERVGPRLWGARTVAGRARRFPGRPLFCVIAGPTAGHAWSASAARLQLHQVAVEAGIRRRFAPHQLRHAHAVALLREEIPLPLIQRPLGHSHLSTTGTYMQGISSEDIISTVHARRAPMMHASAGLEL